MTVLRLRWRSTWPSGQQGERAVGSEECRSMGPVDESRQIFTLDCYFRQYWTDPRLVFSSQRIKELTLNWKFLSRIWRPDTYFLNGQDSYLHNIVVPNKFVRVAHTGRVSYSQRLTVTARCKMDLSKFPHDSQVAAARPPASAQVCPLQIGSFGHDRSQVTSGPSLDLRHIQVTYTWAETPASLDDIELSQYHFIRRVG
jgi:gamma-aminobutyric acid receptor subunit alpha